MGWVEQQDHVSCDAQAGCNRLLKSLGAALGDATIPSSTPLTTSQAGQHASVINNSDMASM